MFNNKYSRTFLAGLVVFSLSGCVTAKPKQEEPVNPVEVSKDVNGNYVDDAVDEFINRGNYPRYEVRNNGVREETQLVDLIVKYGGIFSEEDGEVIGLLGGMYDKRPLSTKLHAEITGEFCGVQAVHTLMHIGLPKESLSQFYKTQGDRVSAIELNHRVYAD